MIDTRERNAEARVRVDQRRRHPGSCVGNARREVGYADPANTTIVNHTHNII